MDLSIIVVSYNTRELLADCLRSIAASTQYLAHEVIVVDNASQDASAEMVAAEFPEVRLISNDDNRGFAAANNQAIAVARGEYVLLLNSDARLRQGALQDMVSHLATHPRTAVVGGQLFNTDGTFQSSYFDFPGWSSELLLLTGLARWVKGPTFPSHKQADSTTARSVDWVSGALFMVRRAAIDEIGLLDERYFMYAEEMDWCLRMHQNGWGVDYLPEAQAVHVTSASAHRQPERRRAQVYWSKYLFVRKHWGGGQAALFFGLLGLLSVTKLIAWSVRGLVGRGAMKDTAAGEVHSYRFLLARLAEAA